MSHDIIDNRNERLVDHILKILPSADRAKFAVGYFFLSGLEALGKSLDTVKELRLLIGNTSNRQTIEQLTEGYKRLELVEQAAEEMRFAKRVDRRRSEIERPWHSSTVMNDAYTLRIKAEDNAKVLHA